MSQLTLYNLRNRERKNSKNINNGGETRNLEGDTVNNSPKEFLHLVHNSLENSDSELINDFELIEVRNISALPFNGPEDLRT